MGKNSINLYRRNIMKKQDVFSIKLVSFSGKISKKKKTKNQVSNNTPCEPDGGNCPPVTGCTPNS